MRLWIAISILMMALESKAVLWMRAIPTTTQFARDIFLLETAQEWRTKLGIISGDTGSSWDPISTNILSTFQFGTANLTNWSSVAVFSTNGLATTNFVNGFQRGDTDLTNWASIDTNILSGLQRGNANITNWGQLATNLLYGKQLGSANLTNWSLFGTNILSTKQTGSVNLTNWSGIDTNVLLTLLRTNQVVETTAWVRVTNYSNAITITESSGFFDTNGALFSWISDGSVYRVEYSMMHSFSTYSYTDYTHYWGLYWTNDLSYRMDFLLADSENAESSSATGNIIDRSEWLSHGAFNVVAPVGNQITLTNAAKLGLIFGVTNFTELNQIRIEVSKPKTIYTIAP